MSVRPHPGPAVHTIGAGARPQTQPPVPGRSSGTSSRPHTTGVEGNGHPHITFATVSGPSSGVVTRGFPKRNNLCPLDAPDDYVSTPTSATPSSPGEKKTRLQRSLRESHAPLRVQSHNTMELLPVGHQGPDSFNSTHEPVRSESPKFSANRRQHQGFPPQSQSPVSEEGGRDVPEPHNQHQNISTPQRGGVTSTPQASPSSIRPPSGSPSSVAGSRPSSGDRRGPSQISKSTEVRLGNLKVIGKGASGTVYRGVNTKTREFVAVKEMVFGKRDEVARAFNEIALMKTLDHPNIVRYLGAERDRHVLKIYMEYISGGSLRSLIKDYGELTEEMAQGYCIQTLHGLAYLHERNIAHRDIKCDNLLVEKNGDVKLADFGQSKQADELKTFTGTACFMAPEVIRGDLYTFAADIWSFGCAVIEMLAGNPPYTRLETEFAVMFHITHNDPADEIPENISTQARDFITRCLQLEPGNRSTATALLRHPWLEGTNASNAVEAVRRSLRGPLPTMGPPAELTHVRRSPPPLNGVPLSDDGSPATRSDTGDSAQLSTLPKRSHQDITENANNFERVCVTGDGASAFPPGRLASDNMDVLSDEEDPDDVGTPWGSAPASPETIAYNGSTETEEVNSGPRILSAGHSRARRESDDRTQFTNGTQRGHTPTSLARQKPEPVHAMENSAALVARNLSTKTPPGRIRPKKSATGNGTANADDMGQDGDASPSSGVMPNIMNATGGAAIEPDALGRVSSAPRLISREEGKRPGGILSAGSSKAINPTTPAGRGGSGSGTRTERRSKVDQARGSRHSSATRRSASMDPRGAVAAQQTGQTPGTKARRSTRNQPGWDEVISPRDGAVSSSSGGVQSPLDAAGMGIVGTPVQSTPIKQATSTRRLHSHTTKAPAAAMQPHGQAAPVRASSTGAVTQLPSLPCTPTSSITAGGMMGRPTLQGRAPRTFSDPEHDSDDSDDAANLAYMASRSPQGQRKIVVA